MVKPLEHPATAPPPEAACPARPRVLLVDDEQAILNALRRLLRREGYEIFTATRGDDALEVLAGRGPFDLLVTDFRMPDMSGIELLQRVEAGWPDTQRVMLSGYSEVNTILEAVNRGAVYKYLVKPWKDEELKLNLRRAVEQAALRRINRRLVHEVAEKNRRLTALNARLERDFNDAVRGLNFNQALFEWIDAAVLTVDTDGLVVGANARLIGLLGADVIGRPAGDALPAALHPALAGGDQAGRLHLGGRGLQWRSRMFMHGHDARGRVVTLWEEL